MGCLAPCFPPARTHFFQFLSAQLECDSRHPKVLGMTLLETEAYFAKHNASVCRLRSIVFEVTPLETDAYVMKHNASL